MRLRFLLLSAVLGLPAVITAPNVADAQTPQAIDNEFPIANNTAHLQGLSRAAADADGNFVVVWEASGGLDGSSWGVFGRQFDADGNALAAEFQVNTYTTDLQVYPNIAMRPTGEFVVTWQSYGQDGSDFGVFGQLFDSAGNDVGGELTVNTTAANYQGNSSVAFRDDGGFLVIWESTSLGLPSDDIFGQLFDSAGNAVGGEIQINTTTASDQNDPRLAASPDGFVAVWESLGQDGDRETVAMQMLDADAAPDGAEIVVNQTTDHDQEDPEVSVDSDGTFVVVWESFGQDSSYETAVGRIYNADGTPRTDEFQINTYTNDDQEEVEVAPDGNGGFVAVWESTNQLGDGDFEDVFGRRFDSAGQLVGAEFQVNTYTEGNQDVPHLIQTGDGRLLVTWRDDTQEPGSAGVYAQRYDIAFFADGFESGDTSGWTSSSP